jgi:hypothetical protein
MVSFESNARTVHLSQFKRDGLGQGLYFWESRDYAESEFDTAVRFKLVYEGKLLATKSGKANVSHKHQIRKAIHRQLAELWNFQFPLPTITRSQTILHDSKTGQEVRRSNRDDISDRHTKFGFRFTPLIERENGLVCKLDIQFLRRSGPGEIVEHGGDLDNRIKTLLDALQVPTILEDGEKPDNDENPFFCLLEDDALITEMNVTADRLLTPVKTKDGDINSSTHPKHDVLLIIGVETLLADPIKASNTAWMWS